jgi:hypothetical protein
LWLSGWTSVGGCSYLIGKTFSDNFPVTRGAAQLKRKGKPDAFVAKLARAPSQANG